MDTHSHIQDTYEKSRYRAFAIVIIILSLLTAAGMFAFKQLANQKEPVSYEECVGQNGSQTQLSYPGVCITKSGKRFVQPLTPEEQENLKPPAVGPSSIPGWETYENNEYRFSLQYPPEWDRRTDSQMFSEGLDLFSVHIYGETQAEGTEVYDGASFTIGAPIQTDKTISEYVRDTHEKYDPGMSEPPVFSTEEINGAVYEKVYFCALGCFSYYYRYTEPYIFRIVTFSEGPDKAQYEGEIMQMITSLTFHNGQSRPPLLIPSLPQVSWQEAVNHIKNCEVEMAAQTHSLYVNLTLKDGRTVTAKEPAIDDVFEVVNEAQPTCGTIAIATE